MKWTNSNKYKFSYSFFLFLNVQVGFQKQWVFLLDEEARSCKTMREGAKEVFLGILSYYYFSFFMS